jgi:hypothetical protein
MTHYYYPKTTLSIPAYLDQMVEAARFGWDLTGDPAQTPDFDLLRDYLGNNLKPEFARHYGRVRQLLETLSAQYLAQHPGTVTRACHAVSHGFHRTWSLHPLAESFPLQLTVGTVYYQGCNVFEVTRGTIERTVAAGFLNNQTVDVHVWLTLGDLTVLDLTIVPTLRSSGVLPPGGPEVLLWRADEPGDFVFEPLMLDNDFYERVERMPLLAVPFRR